MGRGATATAERVLASLGLLEEYAPQFAPAVAIVRYRRYEAVARAAAVARSLVQLATPDEGPLTEARCAEYPNSFMGMPHPPLPQTERPDF
jgi:hypothetical protein